MNTRKMLGLAHAIAAEPNPPAVAQETDFRVALGQTCKCHPVYGSKDCELHSPKAVAREKPTPNGDICKHGKKIGGFHEVTPCFDCLMEMNKDLATRKTPRADRIRQAFKECRVAHVDEIFKVIEDTETELSEANEKLAEQRALNRQLVLDRSSALMAMKKQGPKIESQAEEIERLRECLIDAKGYIMANARESVHAKIAAYNSALSASSGAK